jgi:hypothetical protein
VVIATTDESISQTKQRVNKMTTENTTLETTTEALPLTPEQIAEEFVKENTTSMIVEEFVNNYKTIERQKEQLLSRERDIANQRAYWASKAETIEEFLKEHISDKRSASVEQLKELAEELDIELTKTINVTFNVRVEAEVTVPLDFDADRIDDGDFDIRIDDSINYEDTECVNLTWEVEDFDASEDN